MITRALVTTVSMTAMLLTATAVPAVAGQQSTKENAGWGCGDAVGLPAGHCITAATMKNFARIVERGQTFQLQVFNERGEFVTTEIATFNASADSRPCPHDTDSRNVDGTYWEFAPGLYVCHHRAR